jgi:Transcription factor WhiB
VTAPVRVVEVLAWHPPAPGSNIRDRDWREAGLCAQADPEVWFPEGGARNKSVKAICDRCPVRERCLQHALDNHPIDEIWGGTSERERRRLVAGANPADDARPVRRLAA